MTRIESLLVNNQKRSLGIRKKDPKFFRTLSRLQKPEFLWIGCSDSRVPANKMTGLLPGELFVHRNVANMVYPGDLNCLSVLQYAIEVLKVKYVILCGHYGCGEVRAVIESAKLGEADAWLNSIRENMVQNASALRRIKGKSARIDRLCELNVLRQAQNLCKIKFVQRALEKGHLVGVHAWIYNLRDGLIKELCRYADTRT